jgi:protein-S-isoprenylcysteine O-methyltransferase Ste14
MSRAFAALRALVYMSGFIALWGWFAVMARDAGRGWPVLLPEWASPLGIVLMVLGGLIVVACGAAFVLVGRGTPMPLDAPRQLVPVGPYRFVRNPMYAGAVLVLLGYGLIERSLAVWALALCGWLLAHLLVVFREEPVLEERFGESYRSYKRSVGRWIPKWRKQEA